MKTPNFAKFAFTKKSAAVLGATALCGALVAGGIAAAAHAGYGHDRHGHGDYSERRAGKFIGRMSEKLSLNEAQETQLAEIAKNAANKRKELRDNAQQQIQDAVRADSLSKQDALRLMELRKQTREDMKNYMAEQFAAFHATLDAEQREKLAEVAPRMLSKLGGKHGKRGRHGGHGGHDDDDDDHRRGKHGKRWYH